MPMWCALALAAATTVLPTAHAAADSTLTATPTMLRTGGLITVTGDICPTPNTVTSVSMQTMPEWFPKGTPPFVPLDMGAISLTQTASGVAFQVTATDARTTRFFQVNCSDGTSATTATGVAIMPPVGQFWWAWNSYGTFTAEPGFTFYFGAATMDCAVGATADASIIAPNGQTVIGPLTSTVDSLGRMLYEIPIPSTFFAGNYTGTIRCAGPNGPISNSVQIGMGGSTDPNPPVMPPTGSSIPWWPAALITLLGLGFYGASRTHARRPADAAQ